jgi:hypothetical protein
MPEDRALVTVKEARARLGGIAQSTMYGLLRSGDIESVRFATRRRMIPVASLNAYIDRLPRIAPDND